MLRALYARLRTRFERRDDEAEEDPKGFVRSRLDASVLFAHGMGGKEVEREMADIEEQARILEEQRRDE